MATEAADMVARRRFTLEEYRRMGEVGILDEGERVELIEGDLVQMTPIGPRHASVVSRLTVLLSTRLADRAIPWAQNPVVLPPSSQPQPDVVLLRPRQDFYASGHPEPADVLLVIEVMDSSAAYDRRIKLPLYARAGIVEVWLVDLDGRAVEAYRDPTGQGYAERQVLSELGVLSPRAFPELQLGLADILG